MLEIKDLYKSYGEKPVLKGIHCKLENGLYGLLGPNGAGKSTLMNIITTNLKADSGMVLWNGQNIEDDSDAYRSILGYMPQQQGLYPGFSGAMFLNYIAALKEVAKEDMKSAVEEVVKGVNLQDHINRKIKTYSGGMKQRLLIASAMIARPKLIIFDEPTAGLDPKERIRVKKLLRQLADDKIIIVATHIVPDIENNAKEVLVLKDGVLLAEKSPEGLIREYAPNGNLEDVYMKIFADGEEISLSGFNSRYTGKICRFTEYFNF